MPRAELIQATAAAMQRHAEPRFKIVQDGGKPEAYLDTMDWLEAAEAVLLELQAKGILSVEHAPQLTVPQKNRAE